MTRSGGRSDAATAADKKTCAGAVRLLVPREEPGAIDRRVMIALYEIHGEFEAERQIAAAVETIALRLIDIREIARHGRLGDCVPLCEAVAEEAARLGLVALARAGRALAGCAEGADSTASLAVLSRLLRLGEHALGAVLGERTAG